MYNIETICVCGAGTMGSGIAQVAAQAGFYTIQYDLSEEMLQKSKTQINSSLDFLVHKQKITTAEKEIVISRIAFTSDINACIADLFIEAIIEKKAAKINLFNQLAEMNHRETIFATNTSSISVSEIASGVINPARVAGMHFFNPAPVMKLVEIIQANETADWVINALNQVCTKMQKTAVNCKDAPGFIVNRVARHYYLEAMHLVEQGKASIENVDEIMEATGFKMGPFKLMDLIGMDINYSVSKIVWEALDKPLRLTPSNLQAEKVQQGNLGKKTGRGFYDYQANNKA